MNKIYLDLFKKLTTAYKESACVNIEIRHNEKNRFYYSSFPKISEIEIEDDYISIIPEDGGELFIYENDDISYFERRGKMFPHIFLIKIGDISVIIDTESGLE